MARKRPPTRDPLPEKPSRSPRAEFLSLAKARYAQWQAADKDQTARELSDLKFYAGEQWPEDIKAARAGQDQNGVIPPVPARPCLTINKVREPVRQVLNQERQADMGASLVPADDFEGDTGPISKEEIELREGLLRRIQRESHAADARTWAFTRAAIAGRGYYGITTQYAPGKTFDQEIVYRRFYNQAAVGLDPAHEQPDGSDAEWGFIGTWVPWPEYRAEYGERNGKKNRWAQGDSKSAWEALGAESPKWVEGSENTVFKVNDKESETRDTRAVLVVEYYYTERTTVEIALVEVADPNGLVAPQLLTIETSQLTPRMKVIERRRYTEKQIKWAKIDGCDDDVLEETDWPGQYIPIIKVLGEELQPYDDERRCEGMVRSARDSNQGFNFMISAMVETIALAPKAPIVGVAGQFEGFESAWDQANVRNIPRLEYNARVDGVPETLPPPQRQVAEPPIQAIAVALREFDSSVRATTGGAVGLADPSVGGVDPALRSGKAIARLLQEKQSANSNFLDNLKRSCDYEARIVNDLLWPIYGRRPGRLVRLLNGELEPEAALLGVPYVMDGQKPLPAQPGQPDAKQVSLTKGATFNVAIKVGRDYDLRRQEEGTAAGELLAAKPDLWQIIGDIFVKNQDWPGSQEMADRFKVMLAPPIQQLLSQKTPLPPEAQAQIAQLQQQLEGLGKVAQEQAGIIQTKGVEQQGKLQEAQLKEQAENQREQLRLQAELLKAEQDNAAKVQIAEIQANTQFGVAELKAGLDNYKMRLEHIETLLGHEAEAAQLRAEQAHDAQQLGENRAMDVQMQREERAVNVGEAREGRQFQREERREGEAFQADEAERGRMAEQQMAREQAQSQAQP